MSPVFSYPNRIPECTVTADNPSDWSDKLPLENVKNRVLTKVARTKIGIRSAILKVNLSEQSRPIGCVAVAKHNCTVNARVRFEGFSGLDFTGTKRFDSTAAFRAYPILYPMGSGHIEFESKNFFLGTLEESERKSYNSLTTFYPPSNQMCQSVRITVTDPVAVDATSSTSVEIAKGAKTFVTSVADSFYSGQYITIYSGADMTNFMAGEISSCVGNTLILNVSSIGGSGVFSDWKIINGDNFLQIGRIFLGKVVSPAQGCEFGDFSSYFSDNSEMKQAKGNTKYFRVRPRMRVAYLKLKYLSRIEALNGFLDSQRELGIFGEILFAKTRPEYVTDGVTNINLTSDSNHFLNTFLCTHTELNAVTDSSPVDFETVIKLEEIV